MIFALQHHTIGMINTSSFSFDQQFMIRWKFIFHILDLNIRVVFVQNCSSVPSNTGLNGRDKFLQHFLFQDKTKTLEKNMLCRKIQAKHFANFCTFARFDGKKQNLALQKWIGDISRLNPMF